MDTEKNETKPEQVAADNPWYMIGGYGEREYVVVARSALGRVGYRNDDGFCFRVRVTPASKEASQKLAEKFTDRWDQPEQFTDRWDQPEPDRVDGLGLRYAQSFISTLELLGALDHALNSLKIEGNALELNPAAPNWAKQMAAGATPGDVANLARNYLAPLDPDVDELDDDFYAASAVIYHPEASGFPKVCRTQVP